MEEKNTTLMEQFAHLEALLHRYQGYYMRNFGPVANPHRGQGRVLALLKLQPEITQKELGYLLDMRNQSLGELLAKLERNNYITRTPSEQDKRVMNIRLTEEGAAATEKLGNAPEEIDNIFQCLSEEEQKSLGEYLERIITALENVSMPEWDCRRGRQDWHRRPRPMEPMEGDDMRRYHPKWNREERVYSEEDRFFPFVGR